MSRIMRLQVFLSWECGKPGRVGKGGEKCKVKRKGLKRDVAKERMEPQGRKKGAGVGGVKWWWGV